MEKTWENIEEEKKKQQTCVISCKKSITLKRHWGFLIKKKDSFW